MADVLTLEEAFLRFKSVPFLAEDRITGRQLELHLLDAGSVVYRYCFNLVEWHEMKMAKSEQIIVVDYLSPDDLFGNHRVGAPAVCTCDFYQTILTIGCQCGGQ